jgi:SPP1 gp7 family putative phage head morphogenesis protein
LASGKVKRYGVFKHGVLETTTNHARAIVRTSVTDISNRAAREVYSANDDLTKEFRYVATLDSRTSDICMGLDGQQFEYDSEAARYPPQHVNCRSTIVPVLLDEIGVPGDRASEGGPVPADTNYQDWLKGQDTAKQNAILGPQRAQMFRDGKINLRDLVRSDGTSLTVDGLRARAGVAAATFQSVDEGMAWAIRNGVEVAIDSGVADADAVFALDAYREARARVEAAGLSPGTVFRATDGGEMALASRLRVVRDPDRYAAAFNAGDVTYLNMAYMRSPERLSAMRAFNSEISRVRAAKSWKDVVGRPLLLGADAADVVVHEMGHTAMWALSDDAVDAWGKLWRRQSEALQAARGPTRQWFPSIYATESHFEGFAEGFLSYVRRDAVAGEMYGAAIDVRAALGTAGLL